MSDYAMSCHISPCSNISNVWNSHWQLAGQIVAIAERTAYILDCSEVHELTCFLFARDADSLFLMQSLHWLEGTQPPLPLLRLNPTCLFRGGLLKRSSVLYGLTSPHLLHVLLGSAPAGQLFKLDIAGPMPQSSTSDTDIAQTLENRW